MNIFITSYRPAAWIATIGAIINLPIIFMAAHINKSALLAFIGVGVYFAWLVVAVDERHKKEINELRNQLTASERRAVNK